MKKPAINYSWPVILSDFSQDSVNENFSRAKLAVFFKGETQDKRYFSDSFAEKVIATLPYTPVVSCYDEEKEDFVGHASEQQIYGIVDPCVAPVFETRDDGKVWCIAEVVLYTERPDKTGEIAQKIVGQPHSLELNPKTVKYTINYDERKHFKNIEFTAGDFIGVSVLGKDQKPAFAGSEFFSVNEEFENKIQVLRDYCEHREDHTDGGEIMNLQEFMKLSWGDISAKVSTAIEKEYANDAYTYIVDMYEDSAVARFYYYVGGDVKLMRVKYSLSEDGEVVLGSVNEVHVVYEDVEPIDNTTPSAEINMEQVNNEEVEIQPTEEVVEPQQPEVITDAVSDCTIEQETTETNAEEVTDEEVKDVEDTQVITEVEETQDTATDTITPEENSGEFAGEETMTDVDVTTSDPAQVTNVEITPTIETKVSVDDEQNSTKQETNSSSASFTESEREEFETLKRKEKVALVDSYKGSLDEESYKSFMENLDNFSKTDLELELLKSYKKHIEEVEEEDSFRPMRAFALSSLNNNANKQESTLDSFVRKYRR